MEKRKINNAIISIDPELLFNMLKLGKDFTFMGAEYNFMTETFNILINHPDFPDTSHGEMYEIAKLNTKIIFENERAYSKITSFEVSGKEYKTND